ncbi:MAG: hypothetical protein ABSE69_10635 [Roseiarcus sp.]|jgi:hypothetical protein
MRRLLLLGTIGLVVTFGAVSAHVIPNQAALVAPSQLSQTAFASAQSIESRSTLTNDGEDRATAAELHWVGQTFGEDVVIFVRDVTLLGIATLFLGLGAVCVKAQRQTQLRLLKLDATPRRSSRRALPVL